MLLERSEDLVEEFQESLSTRQALTQTEGKQKIKRRAGELNEPEIDKIIDVVTNPLSKLFLTQTMIFPNGF